MGDREEAIKYISDLLSQYESNTSFEEKFYHLVVKENLDKTRLRNAMIISEFDRLKIVSDNLTSLYYDLAEKYCCSYHTIVKVIQNRHINGI